MKIEAKFVKSDIGEVSTTIVLIRGGDDPGIVSIDGMARAFKEGGGRIEVTKRFGRHEGTEAKEWADGVIADVKHQIDEYRTTIPKDYYVEY